MGTKTVYVVVDIVLFTVAHKMIQCVYSLEGTVLSKVVTRLNIHYALCTIVYIARSVYTALKICCANFLDL